MDPEIITAMADFAATTPNDRLSVAVSRIVTKLQNAGQQFESHYTRITAADRRIIAIFQREVAA
jgi:hypothetical protein